MKVARPRPRRRLVLEVTRLSPTVRRERREFARDLKAMPKPVPWEWAAPRLLPLLAGPRFDPPGETLVRAGSVLGPVLEFGFLLGRQFARVDQIVAQRWECTAEQIRDHAMANLRERAESLGPGDVRTGVMSGRQVRMLDGEPPWASSLLLVPDALKRVFGTADQLLAASRTDCLLSMPADTPGPAFGQIAIDLERELDSLWLDPFALADGVLEWAGNVDDELDEDADDEA